LGLRETSVEFRSVPGEAVSSPFRRVQEPVDVGTGAGDGFEVGGVGLGVVLVGAGAGAVGRLVWGVVL
jgi:hypothetical protein